MDKLLAGESAFDDSNDDIRSLNETNDYDLKPKELERRSAGADNEGQWEYTEGASNSRQFNHTSRSDPVGPKGVIADYERAKHQMYIKHEKQKADLEREAKKNSFTVLSSREEEILAAKEIQIKQNLEELIDDEDEFFKQYRELRMKQWREQQIKRFGELTHITREDFIREVDEEPTTTFVVVHLYETYYEACVRTNDCLKIIAQRYTDIKFLKAIASDVKPDWDPIALPSILIYKGGGTFVKSFLQITQDLGEKFTWRDLEELFVCENIITSPID